MTGRLLAVLGRVLLRLRYRIRIVGLEKIRKAADLGILLLPNHPALIDPVIMVTALYPFFRPFVLADRAQIDFPVMRWIARRFNIVPIPDPQRDGNQSRLELETVFSRGAESVKAGGNLLIYPAGRIYRSKLEDLGGNSAVETILNLAPEARVVMVRTRGLWGSCFSRAAGKPPDLTANILRAIKSIIFNGIFFIPRRPVTLELQEATGFPRRQGRLVMNRYLEEFYNRETPGNTYVPYTIWEKGKSRVLPEPPVIQMAGDISDVPAATREIVLGYLREMTGAGVISEKAHLARDLGMDSLARMTLLAWLDGEFGFSIPDPEALQSVSDVLLAACGSTVSGASSQLNAIPHFWFRNDLHPQRIVIPPGETITAAFLRQAALRKNMAAVADQNRGVMSYRQMILGIMAFKPVIEQMEGEYIGIMLPAATATAVAYFATLFAGKVPVMVNWTVGNRNLVHSLELLGVRRVLTSRALVLRLQARSIDFSGVEQAFSFLEVLAENLTLTAKLAAWFKSRWNWRSLRQQKIPQTAVVLFTSGSESLPKAVPLTHQNILTNIRDVTAAIHFTQNDRMIGFLPPFHSFGLTCTLVLPLCAGIRVVYHPNPTEGKMLARLVEAYGITILVGTPTFLNGIVRAATDQQLVTLTRVVSGAEKCPLPLMETISRRWPGMSVLEGYGITECSPVISVNREKEIQPGTIGRILPSLEHAVLDLDTNVRCPLGKIGMLYVRGLSVFSGYLNYDGPSPFAEFFGKKWYKTGDLVSEIENGLLVFSGRRKRFIKRGGEMISLPAIEEVLLKKYQDPDAKEPVLAVDSTPSETNPELVLFTTLPVTREEANQILRDAAFSPLYFIRMVKPVEKIPLLGTGKTDYCSLKQLLAQ